VYEPEQEQDIQGRHIRIHQIRSIHISTAMHVHRHAAVLMLC
jgi:hypothetical protein